MREDVLIQDGFLAPPEVVWLGGLDFTPPPGRHDVDLTALLGARDGIYLHALEYTVRMALVNFFDIDHPLYCDYMAITKSEVGMGHVEHADAVQMDGSANHTHWRTVTAMLYLNTQGEDFEGGDLVFTRLGQTVQPRSGRLVGFRCDAVHTHMVPPVTSGTRRALALWFTPERSKGDPLFA